MVMEMSRFKPDDMGLEKKVIDADQYIEQLESVEIVDIKEVSKDYHDPEYKRIVKNVMGGNRGDDVFRI